MLAPEADDAAVQEVDLGLPPRLDVLEHARLVVVGHVGPRRVVDQLLRIGVELDALRGGDRLALVDEPGDERAQAGSSQTRPCVSPVSAPIGFVAALKITFRHCGPRASATACVGIPARVHASASRSISASGAGRGSNGPIVVSPLTSHCTWPGSRIFPAGNVVPRITRSTCSAIASSLPTPFWTETTAPSANACATAAHRRAGVHAFVATIPKSHAGSSAGSLVARRRPTDLARAASAAARAR